MTAPSATRHASARDVASSLLHMTQPELDRAYAAGRPAGVPHGTARGIAILLPGTVLTPALAQVARLIWQGKTFDARTGLLFNRVLGVPAIRGKLYVGESWFDDGEAVIIDYKDTAPSLSRVRDEIREIAPGLHLGRSYYRRAEKGSFMLSFGVHFQHGA